MSTTLTGLPRVGRILPWQGAAPPGAMPHPSMSALLHAATAPSPAAATPMAAVAPATARMALAVQAVLLGPGRLAETASEAVRELAAHLGADLVWLALLDSPDRSLCLVAASDGSDPAQPTSARARLLAASGECVDQSCAVLWPEPEQPGHLPGITWAHRALVNGGQGIVSVPLVSAGDVIGALGVRMPEGRLADGEMVTTLEHLACLTGPVLALLQAREQAWHRRLRAAARRWIDADDAPWQRPLRRLLPWAGAAALVVLAWPVPLPVGGHARLEGAVQRVLVAPADGYVQRVHARPGEVVAAGQPLLDLADQDLQLERQRWQSQLAQHLDALAAAQARADRAQLVQVQSKAEEAQAQLDLVDEKLLRSRLLAPFDGIVVQGDLSQRLGAPVRLGEELMMVAPQHGLRVIVEVDERDVARVQPGQRGSVAVSALPWDTMPLRVTRVSPVAVAVDGRNVFEVEAALPQHVAGLRPGLQGNAQIETADAPILWRFVRRLVESARMLWWEWLG